MSQLNNILLDEADENFQDYDLILAPRDGSTPWDTNPLE